MIKICLVEDEEKVASFIKKGLNESNYEVDVASDGASGLKQIFSQKYDLLILDVMLPFLNGVEICKQVRKQDKKIPILILTAFDSIDDKINGLKAGADDYLVKPFHFRELLARLEALLRRRTRDEDYVLTFGDLKLDCLSNIAERAGKKIMLTAKEYALLELFLRNNNKVLSRQFITEKVWGIGFDTGTNVVDVYVNYLRNKIEKGFKNKLIHTVIGKGYMLREE
ncbi:MAG TPA: response regulator transcription factor [Daejeonella sp.]|nr:response regulator transcription factor [Daejeonella sp.]